MSVVEIITRLFIMVDDELSDVKKPEDANLHPSEIVTIGLLFSLKGGKFRRFYRWLEQNYRHLFPALNERTRLQRLLVRYEGLTDRFLAQATFFTIIDTFGIELIHPRREGRNRSPLGRKGISNGRWIIGIKLAWLINEEGAVVDWAWDDAAEPDNEFREVATQFDGMTVTLSDMGFRKQHTIPQNLKICEQGHWNQRFLIETMYSFVEGVFAAKKLYHRNATHLTARLGYLTALLNCLLRMTGGVLSFKEFVL